MEHPKLSVIGAEEWCAFPELGIPTIKARVDSGAKTSSIQAQHVKVVMKGGQEWVKFEVNPLQDNRSIKVQCEGKLIDRRTIKSSSGIAEERWVIKTPVTFRNGETRDIELTLAPRETMEYRMLLGREALVDRFMVNPSQGFALGELPQDELEVLYAPFHKEKSGLKIAVLASNPELYSNKRLMEAGRARGHEMVF